MNMEGVRIKLKQNQANYRREESITNKMTYPLPPFSTVIGALHKACGFDAYHPMMLSIQGDYQSLQKEPYTDYAFLNTVMDDRGILVYMANPEMLSTAYQVVAKAKKSQGNSFRTGKTIEVVNQPLLAEYRRLRDLSDEFEQRKKTELDPKISELDERKKILTAEQKAYANKKSPEYLALKEQIEATKREKETLNQAFKQQKWEQQEQPYGYFSSLTTSLRYYEVLYEVELVLHIHSDAETLAAILAHIGDLTAIGRSEDFVDVLEAKRVSLLDTIVGDVPNRHSAYIDVAKVRNESVMIGEQEGIPASGTVYDLNKDYTVIKGKRVFNKKRVLYCSKFFIDEESQGIYVDEDGYIVDLM